MIKYLFPLLFCSIIACKPTRTPEQKKVDSALESYSKNPSDSTASTFVKAVDTYVNSVGATDSMAGVYILKAAKIETSLKKNESAANHYKQYLLAHPGKSNEGQQLAEVISLLEPTKSPIVKNVMYTAYVDRFPNEPLSEKYKSLITTTGKNTDTLLAELKRNTFDDQTFRIKSESAKEYVESAEMAALINPQASTMADNLYRAGETARTLRDPKKAIELYEWIVNKYPSSQHAPVSFFLTGFITDNDLKDFAKAGKIYNEFITRYPNDEYTESAKFLLTILGKTDSEISKMLDEKAKKKETN